MSRDGAASGIRTRVGDWSLNPKSKSFCMKRLTEEQRDRIIRLYNEGRSLRFLSSELGLAKSTVYYHTRKKFGRKYVQIVLNYTPSSELGEFLGLFATDGCFYIDKKRYHYTLTISLSKYQLHYAKIVQRFIERIIGKRPRIDVKVSMVQLVVRGKAILGFLRHYLAWRGRRAHTIHFLGSALSLDDDFLRGVIRGLIAGDGGVYQPKRRLAFGVVSRRLAQQYSDLLAKFGISSNTYSVRYPGKKTLHHVHVTGNANIEKFKLRVGLTDPAKNRQLNLASRR